jgi:hypothetical protein
MCTIYTFDQAFFDANRRAATAAICRDYIRNGDGCSLLCIDPVSPLKNLRIQSMDIEIILSSMESFFDSASLDSRVFLHLRMATGDRIGVAYNHGFDNRDGKIFFHNGYLIAGFYGYAVDSFALADMHFSNANDLCNILFRKSETFANILYFDYETGSYGMVRMKSGSLYTDGKGNYSSSVIATICQPVEQCTAADHDVGDPLVYINSMLDLALPSYLSYKSKKKKKRKNLLKLVMRNKAALSSR